MTLQWVDEVMDNGRVYCEADTPHGPATVTEQHDGRFAWDVDREDGGIVGTVEQAKALCEAWCEGVTT